MNAIAISSEKPRVAGSRLHATPSAPCSKATRSTAWAPVIRLALPMADATSRPLRAVEVSARRVTGRMTRNTASAPTHRPSGTKKVATIWPTWDTALSVETVSPTGSAATSAEAAAVSAFDEGSWSAPDCRPVARSVAPEASWLAPLVSWSEPFASCQAPLALCEMPDWTPATPVVSDEPPAAVCERPATSALNWAWSAGSAVDIAGARAVSPAEICDTAPV